MKQLQLIVLKAPIHVHGYHTIRQHHVELRNGSRTFRTIYETPVRTTKPTTDAVITSVLLTHAHGMSFREWCNRTQCFDGTLFAERQRTGVAFRVFLGDELFETLSRSFELQPLGAVQPAQFINTRLN